jgi:hypothetical protein
VSDYFEAKADVEMQAKGLIDQVVNGGQEGVSDAQAFLAQAQPALRAYLAVELVLELHRRGGEDSRQSPHFWAGIFLQRAAEEARTS